MKNSFEFLSDEELDWLDTFLLSRFDLEAEDDPQVDEGVICISELDGFFTAVVSGPVMIPPSAWMPVMWGDFPPEYDDEKEMQTVLSLLIKHMNSIAATLIAQSDSFEPLFLERKVEDKIYTIVDEWCEGYMRGVTITAEQWSKHEMELQVLLAPIEAFAGESALQTHAKYKQVEIENLQTAIATNARDIHAYWLVRQQDEAPVHSPVHRGGPRIGRNEPCPCGSGKKYKKCCLH